MSAETEQGLNALQSGNAAEAVTLLERATQSDPTDYQAFMYLGAAYGQAQRHDDAINALTQAVMLQPANAQGRYNLGTAMEGAGHIPQALEAYQQAVQLQPDYPKAQEAAQRLQGGSTPGYAAPTETPIAQGYAPTETPIAQGYAPPAETPTQYAPQGYAPQQPPQYTPPQGGYAPPGQQQTQAYGQPPAYGQPTMMPGQPANPYGQPPVYPGGYAPGAYRGGDAYVEDRFDLKQAAIDWTQVIRAPKTFFEGQVGRTGYKAPLAFLFFTLLVQSIVSLVGIIFRPAMMGATLLGVGLNLTLIYALTALAVLISALVYHGVGKMFGNQADVSGSFRAMTYSQAPWLIFTVVMALATPLLGGGQTSPMGMALPERPSIYLKQSQNTPGSPYSSPGNSRYSPGGGSYRGGGTTQANPFSNPAALGGIMALGVFGILMILALLIWNLVLLVMAISSIQQISTGSAVGVVVVIMLIAIVLAVIGLIALGGFFAAAMSARH